MQSGLSNSRDSLEDLCFQTNYDVFISDEVTVTSGHWSDTNGVEPSAGRGLSHPVFNPHIFSGQGVERRIDPLTS